MTPVIVSDSLRSIFDSSYIPVTESGCWLWEGVVTDKGYGRIGPIRAHRVAYTLFTGEIPDGMTVDHLCHVRCCVNPDHLRLMTHQEANLQGGRGNKRFDAITGEQVCVRGHVMTGENVRERYYKNSSRVFQLVCRLCELIHGAEKRRRERHHLLDQVQQWKEGICQK